MNIILFGPPGAGKGTQAQSIVKKHNYFQLSTGNLLRDEVKSKSVLGTNIEKLISENGIIGCAAGSLFVFKGIYRAVLISYPDQIRRQEMIKRTIEQFK